MARKRDTAEEISGTRREAEGALAQGDPVAQGARRRGVTEQTAYRGRREDGGLRGDQAKRRKARERENARRQRLVADQALDTASLQAVSSGNVCARRAGGRRACPCDPSCPSRSGGPVGCSPRRAARRGARPGWPRAAPAWIARRSTRARRFGRSGSRRITALLRAEGWRVTPKRGERLWATDGSFTRRRAARPHHVWSDAFVRERTHDGRPTAGAHPRGRAHAGRTPRSSRPAPKPRSSAPARPPRTRWRSDGPTPRPGQSGGFPDSPRDWYNDRGQVS